MSNAFYQGIAWLTKKAFVYALVGLGLGLIVGFKLANEQYRKRLNAEVNAQAMQAAAQLQGGNTAAMNQAIEVIDKARKNPDDFTAQMQAADQFMQIQRPEGALEFLIQASKLQPENSDVMSELAGAYFFQDKFADAITWARKTLAKQSANPPAKFYLAYSLILSNQNLNEAESLLTELEASSMGASDSARKALAGMRAQLQEARQGKGAKPAGKAESSLAHGPEENSGARP